MTAHIYLWNYFHKQVKKKDWKSCSTQIGSVSIELGDIGWEVLLIGQTHFHCYHHLKVAKLQLHKSGWELLGWQDKAEKSLQKSVSFYQVALNMLKAKKKKRSYAKCLKFCIFIFDFISWFQFIYTSKKVYLYGKHLSSTPSIHDLSLDLLIDSIFSELVVGFIVNFTGISPNNLKVVDDVSNSTQDKRKLLIPKMKSLREATLLALISISLCEHCQQPVLY